MIRGWRIEVDGFPPFLKYGKTRATTKCEVAQDICEAWDCGMGEAFKNIKRVILATDHEINSITFDSEIQSTDRQPPVRKVQNHE